ncbi:PLDc N-terminal domain-containing protein [Maribacter sp. ANRC-HE7]|uniref:PLDc N-terminal domain-containing protein n=1 Tax=Maribacter aquimaris TaxID=2737171 RepID=A0ABR7UXT1_9FLAO|nr:PLDc N-terminal domain-containing protein [Maribacter aquimaris]MBD0777022.1 PLDc N-terminal domain-containing protein [Maribacter aquimaris]
MDFGFGIGQILILIAMAVLAIAPVVAIIDITKGRFKGANDRLIWILVVLFLNPLGTLLYFLMGKDQKISKGDN